MNRKTNISGFTLIELVIVLSLISLFLFFSAPVLKNIQISSDSNSEAGKILYLIEKLKRESVSGNKNMFMYLNLSDQRIWVTTEKTESEEGKEKDYLTEKSGLALEKVRISGVKFTNEKQYDQNEYVIKFNSKGYSDMASIHLRDEEGNDMTIIIEPFLLKAKYIKKYSSFEDCI